MGTLHQQQNHQGSGKITAGATKKDVLKKPKAFGRRSLADLEANWRSSKSNQPKRQHFTNSSKSDARQQESNRAYLPSSKYIPPNQRNRTGSNSSTSSSGSSTSTNTSSFSNGYNGKYNKHSKNNNNLHNNTKNKNYNNLYKTQLCDTYEEYGECKYGSNCQYAHGKHELREKPEIQQPSAFKTVRCKNYWSKDSICPYGNKCRFVHEEAIGFDADKVKEAQNHKLYKTQECRTYNEVGTCPYGERCAFIHKPKTTMSSALSADPTAQNVSGGAVNNGSSLINSNSNLSTRRRVSQEFDDDVFGLNFASQLTVEQTKDIKMKKEMDISKYIDALATMETNDPNKVDLINLYSNGYTGAPLARQNSIEMFQEHSRFHKWSQSKTETRQ